MSYFYLFSKTKVGLKIFQEIIGCYNETAYQSELEYQLHLLMSSKKYHFPDEQLQSQMGRNNDE